MLGMPLPVRFICSAGVFIATFYAFKQYYRDFNTYTASPFHRGISTELKLMFRICLIIFLYAFAAACIWLNQIFPAIIPLFAFLSIFIIVAVIIWRPECKKAGIRP